MGQNLQMAIKELSPPGGAAHSQHLTLSRYARRVSRSIAEQWTCFTSRGQARQRGTQA